MTYLFTESETSRSLISDREKEVLMLVAHKHSAKQIAECLFISMHTAISHRKNLIIKLGVGNTAGMVRRAFELGLLQVNCSYDYVSSTNKEL